MPPGRAVDGPSCSAAGGFLTLRGQSALRGGAVSRTGPVGGPFSPVCRLASAPLAWTRRASLLCPVSRWRSCQIRREATTPASKRPPIVASSSATPSGSVPLAVKNETFTDLVFWRIKTRSRASTTAPAITQIHAAEMRVRPVPCDERAPRPTGWATGPDPVGVSVMAVGTVPPGGAMR
jgi:hypothetical protein